MQIFKGGVPCETVMYHDIASFRAARQKEGRRVGWQKSGLELVVLVRGRERKAFFRMNPEDAARLIAVCPTVRSASHCGRERSRCRQTALPFAKRRNTRFEFLFFVTGHASSVSIAGR